MPVLNTTSPEIDLSQPKARPSNIDPSSSNSLPFVSPLISSKLANPLLAELKTITISRLYKGSCAGGSLDRPAFQKVLGQEQRKPVPPYPKSEQSINKRSQG